MAKKRVHEIAKEKGISSKEVLAVLQGAGLDVKAAASSVDEAEIERAFAGRTEAARRRPLPPRRLPRRPRRPPRKRPSRPRPRSRLRGAQRPVRSDGGRTVAEAAPVAAAGS